MWHKRVALGLAFAAGALLLLSGPGVRAGLWPFRAGFGMFAGALVLGLAATGAALIGLAVPRIRAGAVAPLTAALVIGAASAAMPLENLRRVKAHPYINDIATDTENPPQFSQPRPYERHFAELQRLGYPDLQSLELGLPPAQAFARARVAAQALGWEVVAADQGAGRIEAVATTFWFGFKDDIAVRIVPTPTGSRVDVRSRSRVGRSDLGANASRIRTFFAALKGSLASGA
jgi:uncharacterized protein (DUF1499 family)